MADTPTSPTATPATTATAKPATNEAPLELGAGALALLALGGAAYAAARRRRRREDEWAEDEVIHDDTAPTAEPEAAAVTPQHDPITAEQPMILAPSPSAFGWGTATVGHEPQVAASADDRQAGESWVERAYRGPSADNPSLSLRKRLRRAAFFDKREREAAAGEAAPVEPDAGLPESAMADEGQFADA